jgi:hypothetical protein
MGEEVDVSKLGAPIDDREALPIQKGNDEEVYQQVLSLIRSGHKHDAVFKSLRKLGFTYMAIESMLGRADAQLYDEKHKGFNYQLVVMAAIAAVVIIGVVSLASSAVVSPAVDCGDDTLCANKLTYCVDGVYKGSFAGTTHEYDIRRDAGSCRVTEKVVMSSVPSEVVGMSMKCVYPMDGTVNLMDRYGPCTGTLAQAHKP